MFIHRRKKINNTNKFRLALYPATSPHTANVKDKQ